jgi:hypothetical protein
MTVEVEPILVDDGREVDAMEEVYFKQRCCNSDRQHSSGSLMVSLAKLYVC